MSGPMTIYCVQKMPSSLSDGVHGNNNTNVTGDHVPLYVIALKHMQIIIYNMFVLCVA